MEFAIWSAAQYRSASAEELEMRSKAIEEALSDASCEVTADVLADEVRSCTAEYKLRKDAAMLRSASVDALKMGSGVKIATEQKRENKVDADMQYREAFRNFVCNGSAIPAEVREAAHVTVADDAQAVVPTTLMNEIVKTLQAKGNIWAKVRKLNVKGGVEIPILTLRPTAKWVGEGASEDQKIQANEKVSFSYFGLECKIAQSILAATVTISAFEAEFVTLAVEAVIAELEKCIIAGDGSGKPMGITKDSRVPEANKIEMSEAEFGAWADWHKKVKAKMKKSYRDGEFIMAQATFDAYIDGMVDKNGQPVGRTNYGINGEETYRFMGKDVETVDEDIIKDFGSAEVGDVVAIFVNLKNYAVNSNLQMTTERWRDPDTNQIKNKCMLICDGKLIDPNGVLLITKKAQG